MQFKVPQNVQIEDKILPFMTLRQLIICGVGGGFTYLIYLTLETQPFAIWAPPVIFLGILTAAIAFLKIHGIPFIQFLLLLLERYLNPTKRVWTKSAGDVFPKISTIKKPAEHKSVPKKKKNYSAEEIAKMTQMLDHNPKT
ncbi:MAG: PrgI family protein [Candidatus Peribacteraceae bacterium]|nr:PrgI family protein [Candidatus Peribacteraceae bacterium]